MKTYDLLFLKNDPVDSIKGTIKLVQLLVTSLNGDKILLSLGVEIIGVNCVFRELWLVSWILMGQWFQHNFI